MSRWNSREDWPRKAREVIKILEARSIPVPANVTAAVAVLDRIESVKPVAPEHTAIRQAYLDGANAKQLDSLVLADLGAARLGTEWRQAHIDAAGAILTAVLEAAGEILPALTEQAEAAIGKLVRIADLGGAKLDDLVRAGRGDDARLLADVDLIAADLDACYDLRDRYLTRGGPLALTVNSVNASVWRDPIKARHHLKADTAAGRYIAGLNAGAGLWFPTPAEAREVAQQIADGLMADAARVKSEQFGVGSTVGWQ